MDGRTTTTEAEIAGPNTDDRLPRTPARSRSWIVGGQAQVAGDDRQDRHGRRLHDGDARHDRWLRRRRAGGCKQAHAGGGRSPARSTGGGSGAGLDPGADDHDDGPASDRRARRRRDGQAYLAGGSVDVRPARRSPERSADDWRIEPGCARVDGIGHALAPVPVPQVVDLAVPVPPPPAPSAAAPTAPTAPGPPPAPQATSGGS